MRIFLLWYSPEGNLHRVEDVCARVKKIFSPLFHTDLQTRTIVAPPVSAVFLQLPVKGWNAHFFESSPQGWVFAPEYPLNARSVLKRLERANCLTQDSAENILLRFARLLQVNPAATLNVAAPPFSVLSFDAKSGEVVLQNDGLGQAQIYEGTHKGLIAFSNRIMAFKALEIPFRLDPKQWATRCTLGWFPMDQTGFRDISFLHPGTQLCFSQRGLTRTKTDVLQEWLRPGRLSREECLDLARNSLIEVLQDASLNWDKPSVGLSGGWDSRCVVSTFRYLGLNFSARVRGLPDRRDVPVAKELARLGGFELRHKISGGLPSDRPATCERSISLAMLWQAGAMVTHKLKSFLPDEKYLDGGVVNVMGQHGEIGRGYYSKMIRASVLDESRYESELLNKLTKRMLPRLQRLHREEVLHAIRQAFRQADAYDLHGTQKLDFFYLFERTRRWASGSLNSQTGLVVAPFLNPDYIRASFGYRENKEDNPFHQYIIRSNSPEWVNVPYARDVDAELLHAGESSGWKHATKGQHYDSHLYWETVGNAVLHPSDSRHPFYSEIFDVHHMDDLRRAAPDELAMLYFISEQLSSV